MSRHLCACGGSAGSTFYAAAIALVSVLLLGILQGILLAAIASIFLLLVRASQPNVAFPRPRARNRPLRRQRAEPGRRAARGRGCIPSRGFAALHQCRNGARHGAGEGRRDAATSSSSSAVFRPRRSSIWRARRMLHDLHGELASRGIAFQIVGARGQVRDVLQADGMAEKTDSANWTRRMDSLLGDLESADRVVPRRGGNAVRQSCLRGASVDLDQGTPPGQGRASHPQHRDPGSKSKREAL